MNFLVPLYLLGAAAIVVPIYLHLRRKPPKDAVEFSSLMFLEPTRHNPVKRRSQLENIPLLLLRCLALLLLAAMFGRPFMRGGDEEREAGRMRTVVLLDTSASMKREGLWEAARAEARKVIEGMSPDGTLAVVAVDGASRTVVGFEEWSGTEAPRRADLALGAFDTLEPGWLSSDLGTGLVAAAELIADATSGDEGRRPARIVVISDLQSGASLDAVAEASWPPGLRVELRPVESDEPTNASLVAAPTVDPDRPIVRVRNDPTSERTTFRLEAGGTTVTAVVPPGESRVIQLEEAVPEVRLSGDEESYDNRLFLAPREPAPVTLQFLGSGNPDDSNRPEYYFRRAFALSRVLRPRFVDRLDENPAILAIARELSSGEIEAVREQVEAGGRALLVVTSTGMAGTLEKLAGSCSESPGRSPADSSPGHCSDGTRVGDRRQPAYDDAFISACAANQSEWIAASSEGSACQISRQASATAASD